MQVLVSSAKGAGGASRAMPVVSRPVASEGRSVPLYRTACLKNLSCSVVNPSAAWGLEQCSSPVQVCSVHPRTETSRCAWFVE
jgi:hypothetical protein